MIVDKTYYPEEIQDVPLPGMDAVTLPIETSSLHATDYSGNAKPYQLNDASLPGKMIAKETIGKAFNTKSRKILDGFEFTESGALQIGKFIIDENGDIRISPAGIIARNRDGETSFLLDGETGDALFKGDVRASTFTNDFFTVDDRGNVIAQSIKLADSTFVGSSAGLGLNFPNAAPGDDVSGSSFSVTINGRSKIILIVVNVSGHVEIDTGSTPYAGNGFVALIVDGSQVRATNISGGNSGTDVTGYGVGAFVPIGSGGMNYLATLAPGTHTIKLKAGIDTLAGDPRFSMYSFDISYLTLGNA